MNCGIVGLPNVGKTALFNLLTSAGALSSDYPYTTIEPNEGRAILRDIRLDKLSSLFPDAEVVHPYIKFIDIAGLPPGASKGEGLGNQFLGNIRNVDCILHVIRAFTSPKVSRFDGSAAPTPQDDIDLVDTELFLSDYEIAERRLKDAPDSKYWNETLESIKKYNIPQIDDDKILLSPKPQIIVVNITSGMVKSLVNRKKAIYIDVKFQEELKEMQASDRELFSTDIPAWESTDQNVINAVKELLDMVTFFTVTGGNEVKGYNVVRGTTAYESAAKVHGDIQKGFIKALIYNFNELESNDFDIQNVKKHGKIQTVGRDYIIQDGDIVEIMFN